MGIGVKSTGVDGLSLLSLFGVDKNLIQKCKQHGVKVSSSSLGSYVVSFKDKVYGTVQVKGSAISLAQQGMLGPASKSALQFNFESAIKAALEEVVSGQSYDVVDDDSPSDLDLEGPSPQQSWGGQPTPPAQTQPATPTVGYAGLKDATNLYQPTKGTSSGSVYYVVALVEGLNVSLRVKGGVCSFRAEGNLPEYKSQLLSMGFSTSGEYASVHFSIDNMELLKKTLGALIGALGIQKVKDVADLTGSLGSVVWKL